MNHSIIVVGNRPCLTILRTMTRSSYPEGCQQCSPTVKGVAQNYSTEPNAGVTTTGPVPPQESSSETGVRNITRRSERSKRLSKGRKEMLEGLQKDAQEKMTLRREKRVQELRVEKERNRRHSLEKCKKEEQEKMKQRRDKRLTELRVAHALNEEEQDRLFPS